MERGRCRPIVVLDDDPTGVQTLAGVRVLLSWDAARVRAALDERPSVHLITNTRALAAERVQPLVAAAARTSLEGVPGAVLVLRGDSTLRGHLLEEYLGVREVVAPESWPVLLLVPALPSAGRVTVGGVHLFERDGQRLALHETEYARDGSFAYSSARLVEWADERSGGLFSADASRELHLEALRAGGADVVTEELVVLAEAGVPAALAPDAETAGDLGAIADGYRAAIAGGVDVIVRCAPTFVGVLTGTAARTRVPAPVASDGVLVVCGSYVPQATRQLEHLVGLYPGSLVEADVVALAGDDPSREIARLATEASRRLLDTGLAVVSTRRERPPGLTTLDAGERIAARFARVVAGVAPRPSTIVTKGGITSAMTLSDGVGAEEAEVVGPIEPGVSRWQTRWHDGRPLAYVVVPGNIGDDGVLTRLVGALRSSSAC